MPDDGREPDIYCDGVSVGLTGYDVLLTLNRRQFKEDSKPDDTPVQTRVGVVRMSLEHAKVMAIVLRRHLKSFEDRAGKIPMLPDLVKQLGISESEDW
jgi:hypothetical protein